ncbi:helix-turn-helix transcriptional regulator [Burkholderia sp. Ap-962]|uniref:helix-turn-helix domain-containing protein n=1 Tax=Burkholderia sp. Ap-962 TaxID=2608333 RepID=UPI00141FA532|nr:helix-turn-helix transcriptional regulator [Burkholderia sp. Ap-962]NIF69594.1 helix-turn-helix transcriptional regulator [Burkholderia sp. Ap-962]
MRKSHTLQDLHRELMEDEDAREAFVVQDRVVRLGQLLRSTRKERGLTQRAIFERTGIDQADLSRIENGEGERGPTLDTLVKYAHALELDLCIGFANRPPQKHVSRLVLESKATRRDDREVRDTLDILALERF